MEVRDIVRKNRREDIIRELEDVVSKIKDEGYQIQFGNIGEKTTYAMIYTPDHQEEYTGYTFIKNIKYYNENTGKLKALYQAIARKEKLQSED